MTSRFEKLIQILERLAANRLSYEVTHSRDNAVSIEVWVPGEHWEIDVLQDDEVEVEVFKSDGKIYPEAKIEELFQRFTETDGPTGN